MKRLVSLACIATLALAGCGSTSTSSSTQMSKAANQRQSTAEVPRAIYGKDILTVVHGNPFDEDQATLNQAVLSAFNDAGFSAHQTNFTTNPGRNMMPGYRVVLALNPIGPVQDTELCATQYIPTANFNKNYNSSRTERKSTPSLTHLQAQAALCRGETLISSAAGYEQGVGYSSSPGFKQLMAQLVNTLFAGVSISDSYYFDPNRPGTYNQDNYRPNQYMDDSYMY